MSKRKFTKTEFRQAMIGSGGHITAISDSLGVSRQTVYNYLDKFPDLRDTLKAERKSGRDSIVELAETKLIAGLKAGDTRMIMFALRHYDREGVPGAVDISSIFSEDVVIIMKQIGIDATDAIEEFENIIRMQADKALPDNPDK